MCIVHTFTFSTLKTHKICYDYHIGMKLTGIVELLSLYISVQQISDLNIFPIMFYESLNVQSRMCELCTFSKIQPQIQFII